MSEQRIAARYAKALFDKATEENILDVVMSDIANLSELANNSKELVLFLQSPLHKMSVKKAAIDKLFMNQHDLTKGLYALMVNKKREAFIPEMAEAFMKLYYKANKMVFVDIESAVALDPATIQRIETYVKDITEAKSVKSNVKIDAEILGGVTIEFNGQIFDNTVATQLKKIKKELQIA
jgi:F-type H+-transporting ATPase subunit delta